MDPVTTIDPIGDASITTTSRRSARIVGAMAGAVVGFAAIGALFLVTRLLGVADATAFALLVGEGGVFSPTDGAPAAWLVPPLAAGAVGALSGPTAARGVRWSGAWMGFVTYIVGIIAGAILLVLVPIAAMTPTEGGGAGPLTLLFGVLVIGVVGSIIAVPVLPLCVGGGAVWAEVVRRVAPATPATDPGSRPIILVAVVGVVLAGLWVLLTTFLQVLVNSQTT